MIAPECQVPPWRDLSALGIDEVAYFQLVFF